MSNIPRGQIWRNIHGAYFAPLGVGPHHHDGINDEAMWVVPCDAVGVAINSPIPMELTFGYGSMWSLVREASA